MLWNPDKVFNNLHFQLFAAKDSEQSALHQLFKVNDLSQEFLQTLESSALRTDREEAISQIYLWLDKQQRSGTIQRSIIEIWRHLLPLLEENQEQIEPNRQPYESMESLLVSFPEQPANLPKPQKDDSIEAATNDSLGALRETSGGKAVPQVNDAQAKIISYLVYEPEPLTPPKTKQPPTLRPTPVPSTAQQSRLSKPRLSTIPRGGTTAYHPQPLPQFLPEDITPAEPTSPVEPMVVSSSSAPQPPVLAAKEAARRRTHPPASQLQANAAAPHETSPPGPSPLGRATGPMPSLDMQLPRSPATGTHNPPFDSRATSPQSILPQRGALASHIAQPPNSRATAPHSTLPPPHIQRVPHREPTLDPSIKPLPFIPPPSQARRSQVPQNRPTLHTKKRPGPHKRIYQTGNYPRVEQIDPTGNYPQVQVSHSRQKAEKSGGWLESTPQRRRAQPAETPRRATQPVPVQPAHAQPNHPQHDHDDALPKPSRKPRPHKASQYPKSDRIDAPAGSQHPLHALRKRRAQTSTNRQIQPTREAAHEPAHEPAQERAYEPAHQPTREPTHEPAHEPAPQPIHIATAAPAEVAPALAVEVPLPSTPQGENHTRSRPKAGLSPQEYREQKRHECDNPAQKTLSNPAIEPALPPEMAPTPDAPMTPPPSSTAPEHDHTPMVDEQARPFAHTEAFSLSAPAKQSQAHTLSNQSLRAPDATVRNAFEITSGEFSDFEESDSNHGSHAIASIEANETIAFGEAPTPAPMSAIDDEDVLIFDEDVEQLSLGNWSTPASASDLPQALLKTYSGSHQALLEKLDNAPAFEAFDSSDVAIAISDGSESTKAELTDSPGIPYPASPSTQRGPRLWLAVLITAFVVSTLLVGGTYLGKYWLQPTKNFHERDPFPFQMAKIPVSHVKQYQHMMVFVLQKRWKRHAPLPQLAQRLFGALKHRRPSSIQKVQLVDQKGKHIHWLLLDSPPKRRTPKQPTPRRTAN